MDRRKTTLRRTGGSHAPHGRDVPAPGSGMDEEVENILFSIEKPPERNEADEDDFPAENNSRD